MIHKGKSGEHILERGLSFFLLSAFQSVIYRTVLER